VWAVLAGALVLLFVATPPLSHAAETPRQPVVAQPAAPGARDSGAVSREGNALLDQATELTGDARSNENLKKAVELLTKAVSVFERDKDVTGQSMALLDLGSVYWDLRITDKAKAAFEKSLALATAARDTVGRIRALNNLGLMEAEAGQHTQALALYDEALSLLSASPDPQLEAVTRGNVGVTYRAMGKTAEAKEAFTRELELAREAKDLDTLTDALHNLSEIASASGNYGEAAVYLEEAVKSIEKLDFKPAQARLLLRLGVAYYRELKFDEAIDRYKRALDIFTAMNKRPDQAGVLNNLGLVFMDSGKYEEAIANFQRSFGICKELNNRTCADQALNNCGVANWKWGKYDKALEFLEQSMALRKELKDGIGEIKALENIAGVYRDMDQPDKALEYYEKALGLAGVLQDRTAEARVEARLGEVYAALEQYDTAGEHLVKALKLSKELKDRRTEGEILNSLGSRYIALGEYDRALESFDASLAIAVELKDLTAQAERLGNIGSVWWFGGEFDKAADLNQQALAVAKKLGSSRLEAGTLSNLGLIFQGWGRLRKALDYFEASLAMSAKLGDKKIQAAALNNQGLVFQDLGQYDAAIELFRKALELRKQVKDGEGEARTLTYIGTAYADQRDYENALTNLREALKIYERIGLSTKWPKHLIGSLYLDTGEVDKAEPFIQESGQTADLGRLALAKSDYEKALSYYEKLLETSQKERIVPSIFAAYTGLGTAYEMLGNDRKAEECFRKAIRESEELRSSLNRVQRERFFDVKVKGFSRTAPYEGLVRVLLKMKKPLDAFKTSEYTKARIFAEAVARRTEGRGLDVPAEVVERDAQLNDRLARVKEMVQKASETGKLQAVRHLKLRVAEVEAELQDYVKDLRKSYPLFAASRYPEPMDLEDTALKRDEWVLAYDVTDSGVVVYLFRGKKLILALFKPVARRELDELVNRFRRPLEIVQGRDVVYDKLVSFDFVSGKKLSDLLLSDALKKLPAGKPVTVVPHVSLAALPFEALVLNAGGEVKAEGERIVVKGADFFGDRNPIVYCQSVTALTLARNYRRESTSGDRVLVVADPVFTERDSRAIKGAPTHVLGSDQKFNIQTMEAMQSSSSGLIGFERLPDTETLAKGLSSLFPSRIDLCEGLDATKARLLNDLAPKLPTYRYIVFATHGYFSMNNPLVRQPVLALTAVPPGTDGLLKMSEVLNLKMDADLVALTACQTGIGRTVSGEGTMGMGRAFQYAGAQSVLMSLWSVSAKSSVALMESFFRSLKQSKDKMEALRLARSEIRKDFHDHPFFWAAFVLAGEAR